MTCVPAHSCQKALADATALWSQRSTASDGICASPKHHQQNPNSDHERGEAFDLTHDPTHGCNVDYLAEELRQRRDGRVKYIIRSRRICRSYAKPGIPAWEWAPYTGPDPHEHHMHVSILADQRDNNAPWWAEGDTDLTPEEHEQLGRVHHELVSDGKPDTIGQMLVQIKEQNSTINKRLIAIEEKLGVAT